VLCLIFQCSIRRCDTVSDVWTSGHIFASLF